jgi:hypothetical protein
MHSVFLLSALLQVGKLLAELVREPVAAGAAGGSSSRREGNAGAESTAPGVTAGEVAAVCTCVYAVY